MEDRVDSLKETVEQIQSEIIQTVDTPEQSESTEGAAPYQEPQDGSSNQDNTTHAYKLDALNKCLQTDGPYSIHP